MRVSLHLMSEMRFDRVMSDAEGLMWRLEKDPFLSSTFGTVTVLDRAPDWDVFRRRIERATVAIPRLRQRVQSSPANLSPPVWVDDPNFDLDHHVRRIACPKPGTLRQVLDLASLFVADPLDRTRPLWQFMVVEGLRGGKAALVQKMHHTITDGERGVELSLQYFDFERDAPEPPPLAAPEPADEQPETHDDPFDGMREFVAGGLRLPIGVVKQVRDLLAEPDLHPRCVERSRADVPWHRDPAVRHRRRPLAAVDRAVAAAARRDHPGVVPGHEGRRQPVGGTLNTAFLTAAADGASAYHVEMGEPVESLRASMVISTRTADSGSNAFLARPSARAHR
jgi:diacylglycerol O-acyltransferase